MRSLSVSVTSSRWPGKACIFVSMLLHAALLCVPLQGGGEQGSPGPISMTIVAGLGSPGTEIVDKGPQAAAPAISEPVPEPVPEPVKEVPKPKPVVRKKPEPKPEPKQTVRVEEVQPRAAAKAAVTEQAALSSAASPSEPSDAVGSGGAGGPGAKASGGGGSLDGSGPIQSSFGIVGGPGILDWRKPAYPRQAKDMHLSGLVLLRITIDQHGRPTNVEVVEGAGHGFDEAALDAARQSRFSPANQNGKPVACVALLPVRFQLKAHD